MDINTDGTPSSEYSKAFLQGMINRMGVSFYKYGKVEEAYPKKIDALASMQQRLERYLADGNTEWLMDAANFAMIEFMRPKHPNAHYEPQDSDTSPGRIGINNRQSRRDNGDKVWNMSGLEEA